MKPQIARASLCVLSLIYVPLYLFVLFVAFVTSGDGLMGEPWAWYAAVAPPAYAAFVGAYAFGLTKVRLSRPAMIAVHAALAPALMYSFLFLGLLLPVFAILFWRVTREPHPA